MAGLASGANFQSQEATIAGTIIREPDVREGRAAYIVRAQIVNGSSATGLVLVVDYRKEALAFEYGDHIFPRPASAAQGSEQPRRVRLRRLPGPAGDLRHHRIWEGGVLKTLPEPHASLLAGLLFGSTGGLPEELQKAFRDTVVFHILPTSYTRNRESRIAT